MSVCVLCADWLFGAWRHELPWWMSKNCHLTPNEVKAYPSITQMFLLIQILVN